MLTKWKYLQASINDVFNTQSVSATMKIQSKPQNMSNVIWSIVVSISMTKLPPYCDQDLVLCAFNYEASVDKHCA